MRTLGALIVILFSIPLSYADSLVGFCTAPTPACISDGNATLVDSSTPSFGFSYVGTKLTSRIGIDTLAFLLPDNEVPDPAAVSFEVHSTNAGTNDATTITEDTAMMAKEWHYGYLGAFLGNYGLPNQIFAKYSAANPDVAAVNPGVKGYDLYLVDLGMTEITGTGPTFTLEGFKGLTGLPKGTFIVDFLHVFNAKGVNDGTVATQNSTALLTDTSSPNTNTSSIPEPAAILLFGTGLLAAVLLAKKQITS